MTETMNAVVNTTEAVINQANSINDMIKEFVELKKQITKGKEERDRLKSDSAALSISIWMGKIKYKEMQKREAHLRNAIINTSKIIESKEEIFKNLTKERGTFFSKLRDKFQTKSAMYMDKFLGAQEEYTVENLTNNIQTYKGTYKKVHEEVTALTCHLKNLETLYRLNDIRSDETSDAINTILSSISDDNNCKLININVAEDLLKELENEIQEKKIMLNPTKNK